MATTQWSGLAPAVDAHLNRWAHVDRHVAVAEQVVAIQARPHSHDEVQRLAQKWIDTELGRQWVTFAMSYGVPDADGKPVQGAVTMDGDTISGREQFEADTVALWSGAKLAAREHRMLTNAVSHYVSADVIDEVTMAANLAESEPIFETDLFTPYGFAVFEEPIELIDLDMRTGAVSDHLIVHVRAVGWCPEDSIGVYDDDDFELKPGITLFAYTTAYDYEHGFMTSMTADEIDEWGTGHPDQLSPGLIPIDVIPWRFGREWEGRSEAAHIPHTVPHGVAQLRRFFLAFMRLCWQEIIVKHTSHAGRAERRRWERLAKRKELLDYTVLRLRRLVDPDYEAMLGVGLPLDHRVLVRGHWRRQYMPSFGPARLDDGTMNPESHRLVWIQEHWRGPDDGPLGAMHSATSVTR